MREGADERGSWNFGFMFAGVFVAMGSGSSSTSLVYLKAEVAGLLLIVQGGVVGLTFPYQIQTFPCAQSTPLKASPDY